MVHLLLDIAFGVDMLSELGDVASHVKLIDFNFKCLGLRLQIFRAS